MNKENGKHLENRALQNPQQNCLITVRRDRHQSPLNFEMLADKSAERIANGSRRGLDFQELLNFDNVADEDLWATMNEGQPTPDPDFLFSTPTKWGSSVGSTKGVGSASVVCELLSSRVKMERCKARFEEALKENSELRNQLQDLHMFQGELQNELAKLEKEFVLAKRTTSATQEFWDTLKQTKAFFSKTVCNYLSTGIADIDAVLHADIVKKQMEDLSSRVMELEEELWQCREENTRLHTHCQVLVDQARFSSLDAMHCKDQSPMASTRTVHTSDNQDADVPFAPVDNHAEKDSNISPTQGRLCNGGSTSMSQREDSSHSQQAFAGEMPELDAEARSIQKDHSIRVSDDSWLKRRGSTMMNENSLTDAFQRCANKDGDSSNHSDVEAQNNSEELRSLREQLLVSAEHIRLLERQVVLANSEKDSTKALLKEQLDARGRSLAAMKLEKRRFAEEIQSIMEAIALQDNFVPICSNGVQGFTKPVEINGPDVLRPITL